MRIGGLVIERRVRTPRTEHRWTVGVGRWNVWIVAKEAMDILSEVGILHCIRLVVLDVRQGEVAQQNHFRGLELILVLREPLAERPTVVRLEMSSRA